jgi:hypothetical protein
MEAAMAVYCKGILGTTTLHDGEDWTAVLQMLAEVNLAATARQTKAMVRRRGVRDAAALLRLVLAYGVSGFSLRTTAAWAGMAGIAELCDVSLMDRIRNASDWLDLLWQALLTQQTQAAVLPGLNLAVRLIDATCVSAPKSSGTDYRLHLDYRPQEGRFGAACLTDGRQAEGFHHFMPRPGELLVGDRAYAKAKDIAYVLAAGAHLLVRIGWRSLVLLDPQGNPLNLLQKLKSLPKDRISTLPVQVAASAKKRTAVGAARLIVVPLPPDVAAKSRRKATAKAKHQGRTILPEGAIAANWIILLTTLDTESISPDQLVALYRLRWQIELAFKRLKSILHLDRLPAKDPKLARAWVAANLLAALLIDRLYPKLADEVPEKQRDRMPVWRLFALTTLRLIQAILSTNWQTNSGIRRLIEPPRKRKHQLPCLINALS